MKLGISSWSFHRTIKAQKLNQLSWIEKSAKELSLDGVELLDFHFPSTDENYLKQLKKLCTDLYLDMYLLSVGTNFGKADEKARKEELNKLKRWIDIGYYLGVPVVRYFAGTPQGDRETLWLEMVKLTKEAVEYASEKGIVLALENHNHHGFIQTSKDVLRLFKEVNTDWLKMCLDTGNYKDLYVSIEETAHLAAVVHAKLYIFDENGIERKLNYEKIFEIFKKSNFNGYLSIEYEGEGDEIINVPIGVKYLRRMIQKHAR